MQLVLSCYPGIDLFGRGFEQEGFCVVRGPDLLWGQTTEDFTPPRGRFDGVIGGPPCTGDSKLAYLNGTPGQHHRDEWLRVLIAAAPRWYVMEAVRPFPECGRYVLRLSPRHLGHPQSRTRYFHSNLPLERYIDRVALESADYAHAVLAGHGGRIGRTTRGFTYYSWRDMKRLQGLPPEFNLPALTVRAKRMAVGNAVHLGVARAVALAVRRALEAA